MSLIDDYEAGGAKLRKAVAGLANDDLMAKPIPGKWSTHTVIIHLADAEAAHADRLRRLLADENPTLLSWDENKFTANLNYDAQSAEDALTLIDLTRRQASRILRAVPESSLARSGTHSERGPTSVKDVLTMAITHLDHHLKFIAEKRAALGK